MKMPERMETERLVLRKPQMDDATAIFHGWAQDREVTRYLTWRPHQHVKETQEFVQRCLSAWEQEQRFPYIITLKATEEVIGLIDPRIEGHKMELGYGAARAILAWAFQEPSIYRVYATVDVENIASQRVLEKVGMRCEGILRKYIIHPNLSEVPRDSYIYAMTK